MIETLLPGSVRVAEAYGDPPGPALYAAEEALIADSVDSRRQEFTTGRRCARRALADLGSPPAPLLSGPRGEPLWPDGTVGAITHCAGYRAAAVASRADLAALGVDAEPGQPLPEGVLEAVSLPEERSSLARLARHALGVPWDRLLYSAKESVYKAWFPLTGRRLEFEDAVIRFTPDTEADPGRGRFTVRLLVPGRPAGGDFAGRFAVRGGFALTAVTVPAAALPG